MTIKGQFDSFKAEYERECAAGEMPEMRNAIELLKRNACLVDIVHDASSLAEDIFANALEIEETFKAWPRYEEDGSLVNVGNVAFGFDGPHFIASIEVDKTGWTLYGRKEPTVDPESKDVLLGEKYIINQGSWKTGDTAQRTYECAKDFVRMDGE